MTATRLAITGATGMVGIHVARRAVAAGHRVRALVRPSATHEPVIREFADLGVEIMPWDLANPATFPAALAGQEVVVHSAAHVGDWGPPEKYRAINVHALDKLLEAARQIGDLRRWVQISSLGVYPAEDHYGSDESMPPNLDGFDGYTCTKAEADLLLDRHIAEHGIRAVKMRPGFMYGEGDRHVLPRIVELLRAGQMWMIGDGLQLLDNTYVGSLAEAVVTAIDKPDIDDGRAFNIRDERLVTRNEFIGTVAEHLGVAMPRRLPLWLARAAVGPVERVSRLFGKKTAPILTHARMKFMTINLDYSIERASRELDYRPTVDFQEGIRLALDSLACGTNA